MKKLKFESTLRNPSVIVPHILNTTSEILIVGEKIAPNVGIKISGPSQFEALGHSIILPPPTSDQSILNTSGDETCQRLDRLFVLKMIFKSNYERARQIYFYSKILFS